MKILTSKEIRDEFYNGVKWVAVDDYISLLKAIKATSIDFDCECHKEETCAMCAVEEMVEKELNSLSPEKPNTIKDDRKCKVCGNKLSEHSSFSDNHTYSPDKEKEVQDEITN